jgi:outer membrane protein assembly factor BamB
MKQLLASFLLLFALTPGHAEDWPCWRGPDHNGISAEKGWLSNWPDKGPAILWKVNVGTGFSSVAVSKGRLYTMGNEDNQDTVYCFDARTGKKIWSHSYDADLGARYFEGGPAGTPTLAGDRVYTLSRWGDLFCFDSVTGKIHWSGNVEREQHLPIPTWGFAGSPLVHENLLILNVGKSGLALDKMSGKVVWKSEPRESGYSTPVPFQRGKEWYALFSSTTSYLAVHLHSGKVLWEYPWITRLGVNAAAPILHGDQVFLSSGYNKGAILLDIGREEKGPMKVWQNKNMRNQFNSSVLVDGFLYGIDGDTTRTTLNCVDWKTGEVRWRQGRIGSGALMAADGKLIVLSDRGELLVAPATPKAFTPSARAAVLDDKCWTTPVLANGRIYCRSASGDLVCVDVRPGK